MSVDESAIEVAVTETVDVNSIHNYLVSQDDILPAQRHLELLAGGASSSKPAERNITVSNKSNHHPTSSLFGNEKLSLPHVAAAVNYSKQRNKTAMGQKVKK